MKLEVTNEAAKLLNETDPRMRLKGVNQLADIGQKIPFEEREGIVKLLEPLAKDKEPYIRWNVAYTLGKIGHEAGVKILSSMLAADEHANVRFRVALSLASVGSDASVEILEKMTYDTYKIGEHAVVRAFAAIALGRFRHESAVRALGRLVNEEDPVVRWHVAVALGDIGLSSGLEYLAKLENDPIPFVRAHTAIALAQIGDVQGRPILERLTRDATPRVAQIATQSLESFKEFETRRFRP